MSIIHTVLPRAAICMLGERDQSYLKQKLKEHGLLNQIMHRRVNQQLLNELLCILDRKPIPRQHTEHRNGKLTVTKVSPEEMNRLWK